MCRSRRDRELAGVSESQEDTDQEEYLVPRPPPAGEYLVPRLPPAEQLVPRPPQAAGHGDTDVDTVIRRLSLALASQRGAESLSRAVARRRGDKNIYRNQDKNLHRDETKFPYRVDCSASLPRPKLKQVSAASLPRPKLKRLGGGQSPQEQWSLCRDTRGARDHYCTLYTNQRSSGRPT